MTSTKLILYTSSLRYTELKHPFNFFKTSYRVPSNFETINSPNKMSYQRETPGTSSKFRFGAQSRRLPQVDSPWPQEIEQQYRRGDPRPSNAMGLVNPSGFRLNRYDNPRTYQPQNSLPNESNHVFNEEYQTKMSFRQLNYNQLSSQEKKEQDSWAHSEMARLVPCPMGYGWRRIRGGYRCKGGENAPRGSESLRLGGTHIVTDELLHRRQGEFYQRTIFPVWGEKTTQFPGIKGLWTGPETMNSPRIQWIYKQNTGDSMETPPAPVAKSINMTSSVTYKARHLSMLEV